MGGNWGIPGGRPTAAMPCGGGVAEKNGWEVGVLTTSFFLTGTGPAKVEKVAVFFFGNGWVDCGLGLSERGIFFLRFFFLQRHLCEDQLAQFQFLCLSLFRNLAMFIASDSGPLSRGHCGSFFIFFVHVSIFIPIW